MIKSNETSPIHNNLGSKSYLTQISASKKIKRRDRELRKVPKGTFMKTIPRLPNNLNLI